MTQGYALDSLRDLEISLAQQLNVAQERIKKAERDREAYSNQAETFSEHLANVRAAIKTLEKS